MSKLLKEQWAKLAFGQEQKLNENLDTMDQSSIESVCRQSFEFDTLVKVQDVILKAYPDGMIDTGGIAEMHSAQLSNGLVLDFEQLSDLVCEWMVNYAQACTEQE